MEEPTTENKFAIHEACREGKTSTVQSLLSANPKLASRVDDDGRLPLHWALANNYPEIVNLLITQPKFDVDEPDSLGWTPLMITASLPDDSGAALVDLLLGKDADVNVTNNAGQTALHFAASKNNLDTARKLVAKKASTRTRDRRGQLPLHRAAAVGSVPMLKLLLENRSPVNTSDADGMTALHHAVAEGWGDAAVYLLKMGAEWDKRDGEGRTAIEVAPDAKVRNFVLQGAEREGVDLPWLDGVR